MDDERSYLEQRSYVGWIIGIGAAIAVAVIGYYVWRQTRPVEVPPPAPQAEAPAPAPAPAAEPQVQHPLPQAEAEPLPPIEASDALLTDSLTKLLGKKSLGEFLFSDGIVRRIVATVDNLPREKLSSKITAAKPVPGALAVEQRADETVLAAGNSARYARHVQLLESIDTKQAVALYLRLYPLFQRAYEDLGYPKKYFNDRVVEVIDHLLAAPEPREPMKLVQPKVRYEFVDPDLESASAGQKIMLRIGADNATRVKAKLREVRAELTSQSPKQ